MMIFVSFPYLSKISIYLFFPKGKVLCIFACWKPRRASCIVCPPPPPAVSRADHWEPEETCLLERGVPYPVQQLLLDTLVIK